ncbi:MAG TPA: hypothetical protein VNB64_09875 [Solirubrobacteraceae bacterium]|nr:hypothetical protein [Solirubrobacteraceae bacterium]
MAEAERVRDLAQDALSRAEAARTGLEELLAAVERLRGELSNGTAPRAMLDEARLVALEMAVAGRSREEVERHLRSAYGGSGTADVLADVFGV